MAYVREADRGSVSSRTVSRCLRDGLDGHGKRFMAGLASRMSGISWERKSTLRRRDMAKVLATTVVERF